MNILKGVYVQPRSPYYWLRYYDKMEPVVNKRRKSINTKIEVTSGDLKRYQEGRELQGTPELKVLIKGFKTGLNEKYIKHKTGISILKELKLSEALNEFKLERSIPGKKNQLKSRTLENYEQAVDHFIAACKDKYLTLYKDEDFNKLLRYFDSLQLPAGKDKFRKMSINSRSIYTRSLRALWNYFLQKRYVVKNIIEATEVEEKDPDPIPTDEMYKIIKYFRNDKFEKKYPHHYWIIYFMLLTGCRPSSAIVQKRNDIDFKNKIITIQNVKSGKRKKKPYYKFPLYTELKNLVAMIGSSRDGERLFWMYSVTPDNYTRPLIFWKRAMINLKKHKKISRLYKLKQIRPTFISFLINILKMDIYKVYKLADHADIKITDKHYINFRLGLVREELDDITLESFSD